MSLRYSPSTGGFYPEDIEYPALPQDLVEITDQEHDVLMQGQGQGRVIVAGAEGQPALAAPLVDLAAYANAKQWALATGGLTVAVAGHDRLFATDPLSHGLITAKWLRLQGASPPASFAWQFPAGFVTFSSADFIAAAVAIDDFVQATFDVLAQVLCDIESGAISSVAQIDAVAWPATRA